MNQITDIKEGGAEKVADKPTGLALMRVPFPKNAISKLPKPTKAQTEKVRNDFKQGIRCELCGAWHHKDVVHLDYVGHAALTDRLLDCDPMWNWEPAAIDQNGCPILDANGGMWITLTVCGVTRRGYGDADGKKGGNAVKEVIGDALRNAAMRFGAALDLWHKGELHANEAADHVAEQTPQFDAPSAALRICTKLEAAKDLDDLKERFVSEQEAIADVKDADGEAYQQIMTAKDNRKAELAPRPSHDLGDDEIPYQGAA